ncbi:MAG: o-succinylbenzoate--CoA ligase [Candidatus Bostrichicola ureolyticus]|nr:MAG: o-succinylbenzoate--CoA ligase [Candidatus Bostrichicola ureolyticus]
MWLNFTKKNNQFYCNFYKNEDYWKKEIISFIKEWYNKNEFIYVSTSGTINKKQLVLKKKYMVNSVKMTKNFFFGLKKPIKPIKTLLCLPLNYIASKMLLVRAIILKWKVFCIKPSSNPLKELNINFDFVPMIPIQVRNSISNLHKIKIILIGGAPISNDLEEELKKNKNTKFYISYGMTETMGHIAIRKINEKCYKTLSGISINRDKRGCLIVYSKKILEKPLYTNDLIKLYSKKKFEWLGRYDNVINSGGIKIIPEELEKKLSKIIFLPFFISYVKDKILGQKITLFVEGNKTDINIPDSFYKEENIPLKIKNIVFIEKFLKTNSGKIKRNNIVNKYI